MDGELLYFTVLRRVCQLYRSCGASQGVVNRSFVRSSQSHSFGYKHVEAERDVEGAELSLSMNSQAAMSLHLPNLRRLMLVLSPERLATETAPMPFRNWNGNTGNIRFDLEAGLGLLATSLLFALKFLSHDQAPGRFISFSLHTRLVLIIRIKSMRSQYSVVINYGHDG